MPLPKAQAGKALHTPLWEKVILDIYVEFIYPKGGNKGIEAAQRVSELGKYVTLKDIAKATGLTMASVSRALNDMPEISEETSARSGKWRQHGLSPQCVCQLPAHGKSKFVGIVIPQNTNPYFAGIIADIMAVVIANGYMPLIFNTLESRKIEADAVSAMLAFRVAGILAIPVDLKNFLNLPVPVVTMARQFPEAEMEKFDYVINDERGVELSVRYLATRYARSTTLTARRTCVPRSAPQGI